jgi:phosphonate transport system permease protein
MTFAGLRFVANPPRGPLGWWVMLPVAAATLGALWWAAEGTQLSISTFIAGWPWIADFLGRMLPPNLSYAQHLIRPAIETVQIALWGTLLGVVLALPVCFFAARNLSPHAGIFHALRQVLNVMRGINEIILALIFVAAVGLGPFAGVLAIAVHGAGMLGKFFAEAIEEIDEGPLDALRAAGAGTLQRIVFGVIPQVLPNWVGVILYRFENEHPRVDRARHGGRRRHRLRADQLDEAVQVRGHGDLRARDPGARPRRRPDLLEAARDHPLGRLWLSHSVGRLTRATTRGDWR